MRPQTCAHCGCVSIYWRATLFQSRISRNSTIAFLMATWSRCCARKNFLRPLRQNKFRQNRFQTCFVSHSCGRRAPGISMQNLVSMKQWTWRSTPPRCCSRQHDDSLRSLRRRVFLIRLSWSLHSRRRWSMTTCFRPRVFYCRVSIGRWRWEISSPWVEQAKKRHSESFTRSPSLICWSANVGVVRFAIQNRVRHLNLKRRLWLASRLRST